MPPRYAVYFVPSPQTALWRFGSEVLGHDAYTGKGVAQWHPESIGTDAWHTMTSDPRLYGFHATLKAPFRLAEGKTEAQLIESLDQFAARRQPVALGPWIIEPIPSSRPGRAFLAMVPAAPPPGLAELEGAVVRHFDTLRAPLAAAEIARRNPDGLSPRQRGYLDAYGYPYVLEEFRFHMTLTGAIENAPGIGKLLTARAISLGVDSQLYLDRLGLFEQEEGGRFQVLKVAMLG